MTEEKSTNHRKRENCDMKKMWERVIERNIGGL
jgi:hypothetical protein